MTTTTTTAPAPGVTVPVLGSDPEVSPPLYPCDCGEDGCEWLDDDVDELLAGDGPWVPHQEVRRVVEYILDLSEVCAFFDDHVNRSVEKFMPLAARYPRPDAIKAIREAVNTWHGCPEALCCE